MSWLQRIDKRLVGLSAAIALVLLIGAGVGLIRSSEPVAIRWSPVLTSGFPAGPARAARVFSVSAEALYVGTDAGLFLSREGQWEPVHPGLTSLDVQALVQDFPLVWVGTDSGLLVLDQRGREPALKRRALPGVKIRGLLHTATGDLYAATNLGVFRSLDGGITWESTNQGLSHFSTRVLTEDADGGLWVGTDVGVSYSPDGESWQQQNVGLGSRTVRALIHHPIEDALYAGTFVGVFRLDSRTQKWVPVPGLPDPFVWSLAPDAASGGLYAGTASGSVYRTSGREGGWNAVAPQGTLTAVRGIAFEPGAGTPMIATGNGVFVLDGDHWRPKNAGLERLNVPVLASLESGDLFAATGNSLYRRAAGRSSWVPVFLNESRFPVRGLVSDGEALYAATAGAGVLRSRDGGASWAPANQGLNDQIIITIVFIPERGWLFAGGLNGGVFKSNDGGESWSTTNQGMRTALVYDLIYVPGRQALLAGTDSGLFESDDEGNSWRQVDGAPPTPAVTDLVLGPDPGSIVAGTGIGLFQSSDGGRSWSPASEGLGGNVIRALARGAGNELWVGTYRAGVFRSPDFGATWVKVEEGLPATSILAVEVTPGGEVYAAVEGQGLHRLAEAGWVAQNEGLTSLDIRQLSLLGPQRGLIAATGAGVFRSWDGGVSWHESRLGLADANVQAVLLAPDGESLLAGTFQGGVYVSMNGGDSWAPSNERLTNLDVRALAVGPDGHTILAGTGAGIFHSTDGGATWQEADVGPNTPAVRSLSADLAGGKSLAGTFGGVFRLTDGERWEPVSGMSLETLPDPTSSVGAQVLIDDGALYLTQPQAAPLLWGTAGTIQPQAIFIQDRQAELFAAAGAAQLFHADDVPLPLFWRLPAWYQKVVRWSGEQLGLLETK